MHLIRSTLLSIFLGACAIPALTLPSWAQIAIVVDLPPPPLPFYEQPPIPAEGWIWTPGYWAYENDFGYYWVPGTWVEAPRHGLLWTPGYWAFDNGAYRYNDGYWADQVGFYGGVDYGYGYTGSGYEGGYWKEDHFFYNRAVNNLTAINITNVYEKDIPVRPAGPRVSFNGGQGGLTIRPTAAQQTAAREQHIDPTPMQRQHVEMASHEPDLRESQNKGRPPVAATSRPNEFKGKGVVKAQSAGERPAGQAIPAGKRSEPGPNAGPAEHNHPSEPGQRPDKPAGAAGKEPEGAKIPEEHSKPGEPNAASHEQAQPKAETPPHAEPRTEPQREARPEPRVEPKSEIKPEARPEPKPEPRAQARPPEPPHPAGGEEHKPGER